MSTAIIAWLSLCFILETSWVALFSVCEWVCQASVTPDQISTFSNIYRHTSPLLTMYHLISSSTNLYWPSTSQYRHIPTQYHQVPLIIHHLMSHAQYTWSSLTLISWFLPRKTYWLLVYRSGFVAVSHLCTGVQKARQLCQLGVGAEHCFLTPDKCEILKSTFSLPLKYMKYERLSPPPWKI